LEGAKDVCYPPGLESEFERQEALKAAEERGHRSLVLNRLALFLHPYHDK